ncbi:O-antigen ligase family protein [Neptunomonas sp. XY-337]|uniref:O-antigen ligase family protein n=1 Tax=Neptunomonas sp. XY-337 TaxID=2561897 RepID=UPI0010AADF80|nr:O-antigen ligase family protein [Neptunomonas sp. XY-337]
MNIAVVLVALAVFAQPFGVSFELPTLIMALLGIYDLATNRERLRQRSSLHIFSAFFLCFWLPAAISLLDATYLEKGAKTVISMWRFYFAGVFVISRLNSAESHAQLAKWLAIILLFWVADAWFQFAVGVDIFGQASADPGRISSVFGEDPMFGWMMIPFTTVLLWWAQRQFGLAALYLLVPVLVLSYFISGNRGAVVSLVWMVLAGVAMLHVWRFRLPKALMVSSILVCGLAGALVVQNDAVQQRIGHSLKSTEGSFAAWDEASSYRLTLWATSLRMIQDNPINGVGVRGFRYAYPSYAQQGDFFLHTDTKRGQPAGAFHAHQIVLEALTDMGLIGLVGLLVAFALLAERLKAILTARNYLAGAYFIGAVGVLFPLNTGISIYSSYWGQAVWLLVALLFAASFSQALAKPSAAGG